MVFRSTTRIRFRGNNFPKKSIRGVSGKLFRPSGCSTRVRSPSRVCINCTVFVGFCQGPGTRNQFRHLKEVASVGGDVESPVENRLAVLRSGSASRTYCKPGLQVGHVLLDLVEGSVDGLVGAAAVDGDDDGLVEVGPEHAAAGNESGAAEEGGSGGGPLARF